MADRFDRNVRLFGADGQEKIRAQTAAVVGVGGLGTHVLQQLALLGVGGVIFIDPEDLEVSNKNRYVGSRDADPVPGTRKVDIGERTVKDIDPDIRVTKVYKSLITREGFEAARAASVVFGCLDTDGVRLVLTELTAAYSLPYFDLATEVRTDGALAYGGRVCVSVDGTGCPMCLGVLDVAEAQRELAGPGAEADRRAIYGVAADTLGEAAGPSVVSINGVVASLGLTEFMAFVTGLRKPNRLVTYYGHSGKVTVSADEPYLDCYFCKGVRGTQDRADLGRYLPKDV